MRSALLHRSARGVTAGSLALAGLLAVNSNAELSSGETSLLVTNVLQLRSLAAQNPSNSFSFQLEGDLWWANPGQGRFVLHDTSATEEIEADVQGPLTSGSRVRLTGSGAVGIHGTALQIGSRGPVIDNDGVHSLVEMSGRRYLSAGQHPFTLDWFNGGGRFGLSVEYEGPGFARRGIPDSALWRSVLDDTGGAGRSVNGIDCECFEGSWEGLPDFSHLKPVKTGTVANFDLGGRTRDNNVGLRFTGRIEVPHDGLYRFYVKSDDGSRLSVGEPNLLSTVIGAAGLPSPRPITLGQLLADEDADGQWAQVEGKVTSARKEAAGLRLELRAGAGTMRVEVADDAGLNAGQLLNRRIRAIGFCQGTFDLEGETVAGALLVPGAAQIAVLENPFARDTDGTPAGAGALPLLTTASAVRELKPEQARRGYPLRIQGVVTCVQSDHQAFVVQDSTMGLYVVGSAMPRFELPGVGEYLEVGGVTDEPGIAKAQAMKRLGAANLPEPVHPAWDQLMNGGLDSQWVEIGGLVESLVDRSNGWWRVMLRSRAGVLKVDLRKAGIRPGPMDQYENAVVRLRGCLFADWLPTFKLKVGQVRMFDADVIVDQPAPADLFSVPRTTTAALMRFDPAFDVSHRVKVAGQVVYVRGADYFIMDQTEGLRFLAKQPLGLEAGDLVEAVGYPEISGAAPVLRGAVARKTGHAELPAAKRLNPDDLMQMSLDSTRVRIEALLQGLKQTKTNLVLEMRAGSWRFLARLNTGEAPPPLQVGSRLELTGVYCAQGGLAALGADVAPVDLLLSWPSDIIVLARPPWWTLRRLLVIVGVLACALAAMVLWITQLHRQVEERSAELATQVRNRQRIEQQHALEQERARIAQDLHDELGSDIATISMLAARARLVSATDDKLHQYLDQVRGKAREMVAGLDEIVWAMNPVHDSLASLESYLGRYTERFLGLANVAWRFDGPAATVDCTVDSRQRHQLFVAFKEALTNVVRHSGASEVRVQLQVEGKELQLSVADNGRGLPAERTGEMNGLANMRARIEKLHGRFEVTGAPGGGTTVRLFVPLNGKL